MKNQELVNVLLAQAALNNRRRVGGARPKKKKAAKKRAGKAKSPYIAFVKKYHKANPQLTWAQAMRKASPHYRKMQGGDLKSTLRSAMNYGTKINKGLRDSKLISRGLRAYSTLPLPGATGANDLSLLAQQLGYGC